MLRLRTGDPDAARQLFDRFACQLIALARAHLDSRLRQKVDPEDVLQSAFKSFFLRLAQGQFELHDWDSLWTLLTIITIRKCRRWINHFHTGGRALQREAQAAQNAKSSDAGSEALAREPTPCEAVMLAELVEQLLRGLEERDRAIVSLRLQGYTPAEISAELHRPERTVYRILERVKKRLRRLRDEDGTQP